MTDCAFKAVTKEQWSDFESLFESRGAPHSCWCTVWRHVEKQGKRPTKTEKKHTMEQQIAEGIPVGILVYSDGHPVGWCSIAPRESYRSLGGDETIDQVWSLVCFFIKRSYRGQHLSNLLLDEAIKYAESRGARYVEAYPVDPESPSYRFMGFGKMFDRVGFKFIKKAGIRRKVMVLEVPWETDRIVRSLGRLHQSEASRQDSKTIHLEPE